MFGRKKKSEIEESDIEKDKYPDGTLTRCLFPYSSIGTRVHLWVNGEPFDILYLSSDIFPCKLEEIVDRVYQKKKKEAQELHKESLKWIESPVNMKSKN